MSICSVSIALSLFINHTVNCALKTNGIFMVILRPNFEPLLHVFTFEMYHFILREFDELNSYATHDV